LRRTAVVARCPGLLAIQQRSVFKGQKYWRTRLPPKIKRRDAPNEHKNTVGVFHNGRRLPVNISKHFDRYIDVANDSAYHPPFLVHDYVMDTSDYILEPFNAGKGVVMNRPHVLNSFDFNGIDHFSGIVKKYMHEPAAGTVTFLKARGTTWSSGTNFIEILQNLDTPEGRKKIFSHFRKIYKTIHHVHNGPSILCPFVDGLCMGSAASFVANCKTNATGPKADLCWPETSIGFHPDAGACHILSTLPFGIGEWMALTGSRLVGNSIVKAGLGSYSFTEEFIQAMQIYIDEYPRAGVEEGHTILRHMGGIVSDPFELLPYLEVMEKCFVKKTMPEVFAALEKEAPTNDWAKRQLEKLKTKSPLSLVITLEAINRARTKSINYVLRQDFRLTTRFLDSHDFREGVQKLVVDGGKNGQPKWEHKDVSEVTQTTIEAFFAPTGNEDTEFIIDGHDSKENLEKQLANVRDDLHWFINGTRAPKQKDKLNPGLTEREIAEASFLSNRQASVRVEDVLSDRGYTPPNYLKHGEVALMRNFKKRHYNGSPILKQEGPAAFAKFQQMEEIDADLVMSQERPVSPNGFWRGRNDIYDCFNKLTTYFNVIQHSYPKHDSIIRNRTVSEETHSKVEEDIYQKEVDVFGEEEDEIGDLGLFPEKNMRFPPGVDVPKNLDEARKVDFSDDDYSTAPEDSGPDDCRLNTFKNVYVKEDHAARWDSEF